MTVIVGVRCSDGIVIGTDSAATSTAGQIPVLRTDVDKIFLVGDRTIIAGTGAIGLTQRFHQIVEAAWTSKLFQKDTLTCVRQLVKDAREDFQRTQVPFHQQGGLQFGVVLGAVFSGAPDLIEFGTYDFQPEIKRGKLFFVSMGSGQPLADPFLAFVKRVLWRDQTPTVDAAKIGVYWALNHTIDCAPEYVGRPIALAILKRTGGTWQASLMGEAELAEQAQYITQMEEHLANYTPTAIENAPTTPPPKPPPAA